MKTLPLLVLVFSCNSSDEPEPTKSGNTQSVYVGSTYGVYKSANMLNGYQESDTLYTDQVTVQEQPDSIFFTWAGFGKYKFKKNASNHYEEWYGSHSNRKFDIAAHDSLKCSYWSYGGYSSSFNSVNIEFKGKKQ